MRSHPRATWSSRDAGSDDASFAPALGAGALAGGSLEERLESLTTDRVLPAWAIARQAAARVQGWVFEQALDWTWDEAVQALAAGLAAFRADQGWRGPCARLLDALERARGFEQDGHGPREVLAEELGFWNADVEPGAARWSGSPLAPGARQADRAPVREHALALDSGLGDRGRARLARAERILVLAPSELIEPALEAAWKEGLEPRVVTGEGGPHREGLRLARRLEEAGVAVEVTYDAALVRQVDRVDRVWVGTEATDGRAFLAPCGAEAVLVRARALEVPAELFATRDERLPAGAVLQAPAWAARDRWLLWEHAPSGVSVLPDPYEAAPLHLVRQVITEVGRMAPSRFAEDPLWPVDAAARPHSTALAR